MNNHPPFPPPPSTEQIVAAMNRRDAVATIDRSQEKTILCSGRLSCERLDDGRIQWTLTGRDRDGTRVMVSGRAGQPLPEVATTFVASLKIAGIETSTEKVA